MIIAQLEKEGVKAEIPANSAVELRNKVWKFLKERPEMKITGVYYRV